MLAGLLVLAVFALTVNGHTYHFGDCPKVDPMANFDMSKFLGKWYAILKTDTKSRCVTYNYTATNEPQEFKLDQNWERAILGIVNVRKQYTGHLTAYFPDNAAQMVIKFPFNPIGRANYTVFHTDYVTYGAVFTCQKSLFLHRRSVTILSRRKTLEQKFIDEIKDKLRSFGVDPSSLLVINQSKCHDDSTQLQMDVKINDDSYSPQISTGGFSDEVGVTAEHGTTMTEKARNVGPIDTSDIEDDSSYADWM